jgi:DNA-binding MarR family transcriptional regulator
MNHTLRNEIGQTRPFDSPEQEAYLNVVRTAAALANSLEKVLRPAGISRPQYNVLRILRGAEREGLCRNDLRDRMITRMPDMTRLLDRMEAAGLVTRQRDSADRRMVTTRISDEGRRLLAELDEQVQAEHRRTLGHMNGEQLGSLIELLVLARQAACVAAREDDPG